MWETIAGAVVTGLLTLMGVLISNSRSQAVTETRLEELTREVRSTTTLRAAFRWSRSRYASWTGA